MDTQDPPHYNRMIGSPPALIRGGRWPLVAVSAVVWLLLVAVIGPWLIGLAFEGRFPLPDAIMRSKDSVSLDRYLDAWRAAALGSTAVGTTGLAIWWTHHRQTAWALRIALVVFLIVGLHVATLRGAEPLGSDASLYLLHARNLVEGRAYAETGYLFNPTRPNHSPPAYPPLLPILIAPIWGLRGMDFLAIKLLMQVVLAILVLCVAGLARQFVPPTQALVVAAIVGFSSATRGLKDNLGSDIAFVAVSCGALWFAERCVRRDVSLVPLRHGAYLGVLVYLAIASRTIGIALIPAVLLAEVVSRRKVTAFALIFAVTCGAGLWLQDAVGMTAFGYAKSELSTPAQALSGAARYFMQMGDWAFGAVPPLLRLVFLPVGLLLVVAGVVSRAGWWSSPTFLFTGAYLTLMSLWSGWDPRYVFPLFPLMLTAGVAGALWLTARKPTTKWLVVAPLAATAAGTSLRANVVGTPPVALSFTDTSVTEVMSFLRTSTVEDDVVVFNAPRTVALLARRRSLTYDYRLDDQAQWRFLDSVGATHALLRPTTREDSVYLLPLLKRASHRARPVFTNKDFTIFAFGRSRVSATVP